MGVANCNRGNDGLEPGICRDKPPVPWMGLTFGEGGMARPSRGVLAPPFCRLPGIGGRSNGAGEDILGWKAGCKRLEGCRMNISIAKLAHSSLEIVGKPVIG